MSGAPQNDLGGFGLLESLLAESMAGVSEQKAATAARERVKRGVGSAAERAEDALRIAEWEAKREWEQQANVALFHSFMCECGGEENVFQGLFIRETHQVLRDSQRWRRVEAADAALPNERAYRELKTPMCLHCCEDKGWDGEFYNMES